MLYLSVLHMKGSVVKAKLSPKFNLGFFFFFFGKCTRVFLLMHNYGERGSFKIYRFSFLVQTHFQSWAKGTTMIASKSLFLKH